MVGESKYIFTNGFLNMINSSSEYDGTIIKEMIKKSKISGRTIKDDFLFYLIGSIAFTNFKSMFKSLNLNKTVLESIKQNLETLIKQTTPREGHASETVGCLISLIFKLLPDKTKTKEELLNLFENLHKIVENCLKLYTITGSDRDQCVDILSEIVMTLFEIVDFGLDMLEIVLNNYFGIIKYTLKTLDLTKIGEHDGRTDKITIVSLTRDGNKVILTDLINKKEESVSIEHEILESPEGSIPPVKYVSKTYEIDSPNEYLDSNEFKFNVKETIKLLLRKMGPIESVFLNKLLGFDTATYTTGTGEETHNPSGKITSKTLDEYYQPREPGETMLRMMFAASPDALHQADPKKKANYNADYFRLISNKESGLPDNLLISNRFRWVAKKDQCVVKSIIECLHDKELPPFLLIILTLKFKDEIVLKNSKIIDGRSIIDFFKLKLNNIFNENKTLCPIVKDLDLCGELESCIVNSNSCVAKGEETTTKKIKDLILGDFFSIVFDSIKFLLNLNVSEILENVLIFLQNPNFENLNNIFLLKNLNIPPLPKNTTDIINNYIKEIDFKFAFLPVNSDFLNYFISYFKIREIQADSYRDYATALLEHGGKEMGINALASIVGAIFFGTDIITPQPQPKIKLTGRSETEIKIFEPNLDYVKNSGYVLIRDILPVYVDDEEIGNVSNIEEYFKLYINSSEYRSLEQDTLPLRNQKIAKAQTGLKLIFESAMDPILDLSDISIIVKNLNEKLDTFLGAATPVGYALGSLANLICRAIKGDNEENTLILQMFKEMIQHFNKGHEMNSTSIKDFMKTFMSNNASRIACETAKAATEITTTTTFNFLCNFNDFLKDIFPPLEGGRTKKKRKNKNKNKSLRKNKKQIQRKRTKKRKGKQSKKK